MSKFRNRFLTCLKEQDQDRAAMMSSLDQDTDPNAFDTDLSNINTADPNDPSGADAVSKAMSEREAVMVGQVREWVDEMDAFLKKLNGTEDSIQTALAAAEADTLLDKMKQSEQRKIARVATELASLAESFRGFLAQGNNSSLRYV